MRTLSPTFMAAAVLTVVSLACSLTPAPAAPPVLDQNAMSTSVAQTVSAIQSGGNPSVPATVTLMVPPTSTFTPTPLPTATETATPIFTSTPSVPMISVSVDTNCRVGPGKAYERVGALLIGQFAEVYGRDPEGSYWYIRNPDKQNGYCWVWGEYATVGGNLSVVPVFTPPPTATPAPGFDLSFASLETCSGKWFLNIELENTGSLIFRSLSMTVVDTDTSTTVTAKENQFSSASGCNPPTSRNTLPQDVKTVVSSPLFAANITGHKMRVTVTLCSAEDVNGQCVTKEITFKP